MHVPDQRPQTIGVSFGAVFQRRPRIKFCFWISPADRLSMFVEAGGVLVRKGSGLEEHMCV